MQSDMFCVKFLLKRFLITWLHVVGHMTELQTAILQKRWNKSTDVKPAAPNQGELRRLHASTEPQLSTANAFWGHLTSCCTTPKTPA